MKYELLGLLLASALTGSAFAQTGSPDASASGSTNNNRQMDNEPHHEYGWIGLLGLIGLAGLRKQHHPGTVDTRRN
ncbi:MAG: WGxxGxxG-CTERM domain-containing protein [Acidobacteriota bacterium]|nr:WGxxGxxG-CTERM domain-containing protein [Acidobacteriota bacterium]